MYVYIHIRTYLSYFGMYRYMYMWLVAGGVSYICIYVRTYMNVTYAPTLASISVRIYDLYVYAYVDVTGGVSYICIYVHTCIHT